MKNSILYKFRTEISLLAISAIAVALSFFDVSIYGIDVAWIAIILCGVPIVYEAVKGLVTEFDVTADVLVAIALLASLYLNETFAAAEVAFIMQLGSLLEEITTAKARSGIEKLVQMKPVTAHLVTSEGVKDISADDVKLGDIIRVLPAESVPADGIVTSGTSSVSQALMTGEPVPEDKTKGSEVISGSVNLYGTFDMKVKRAGKDCEFQRLIGLVESADADKAKIVRMADRWAVWVVVGALTASVLTLFITGEPIRAVTVLVVFCPCALVLATPTAIMAAIGNLTKHGILVKEGDALERLAQANVAAFDKTGTVTVGRPAMTCCIPIEEKHSEEEILQLAGAVESVSEHPLSKAVAGACKKFTGLQELPAVKDFQAVPGFGVEGVVNGHSVKVGTLAWLEEKEAQVVLETAKPRIPDGATVSVVTIEGHPAAVLCMEDRVRPEAKESLSWIKDLSFTPILITGDNEKNAAHTARKIGIDRFFAKCLPSSKLDIIASLNKRGNKVVMVGDGFNDAPALKKAHVGIAMGARGSGIATDAADIVVTDDSIKSLPHLFALARRMMTTIKCNLTFSMTLNFLAIALAMTGILNPVTGALVHNAGSVFVIICSALLLNWKATPKIQPEKTGDAALA